MKEETMKNPEGNEKQTYEKPSLRTIELAAEEILAIGCKTNGCCSSNGLIGRLRAW